MSCVVFMKSGNNFSNGRIFILTDFGGRGYKLTYCQISYQPFDLIWDNREVSVVAILKFYSLHQIS